MVRLVLLLAIVGGLAVFALQNAVSPPLSLVFLGLQTPALPLSVWLLISAALGVITSFGLRGLFYLYSYLVLQEQRRLKTSERTTQRPRYRSETSSRGSSYSDPTWQTPTTPEPPRQTTFYSPPPSPTPNTTLQTPQSSPPHPPSTGGSDWEEPNRRSNDWDNSSTASRSQPIQPNLHKSDTPKPPTPDNSRSGSVYDASYRVITPPYRGEPPQPPSDWTTRKQDEEDWGLDD